MKQPLNIVNDFLAKFWPDRAETEPPAPAQEVNLQNLEERVLYDASPLGVLAQDCIEVQDVELSIDDAMEQIDELSVAYDGIGESEEADGFAVDADAFLSNEDRNLIVIDSRIEDYDQLIADLEESNVNYDILELDGTTNGIEAITERLNGRARWQRLPLTPQRTSLSTLTTT